MKKIEELLLIPTVINTFNQSFFSQPFCCWWLILTKQNYLKNVKNGLEPWQIGTHLIELSESFQMNTNMTVFRYIIKYFCNFVLWTKVDSALQGLIMLCYQDIPICVSSYVHYRCKWVEITCAFNE